MNSLDDYTRHPWTYRRVPDPARPEGLKDGLEGFQIVTVGPSGDECVLAEAFPRSYPVRVGEDTVRLMAAARNMLHALHAVMEWATTEDRDKSDFPHFADVSRAIDDAEGTA